MTPLWQPRRLPTRGKFWSRGEAKMEALQEKKSLKEIINLCLAQNLKANQQKTVDLFSKIQSIVAGSGVSEAELQKSGRRIRKQLAANYYKEEK